MPEVDLAARIVLDVDAKQPPAVRRNLAYRSDGAPQALMDVFIPPGASQASRLPAIVFVHGGPIPATVPAPKDWGVFQSYGELAAASGLIGVVFNHRLHSPELYPQSLDDVAAAIQYIRSHDAELGVDRERIALWVFSGAGPHVTWLLRERPSHVKCLVAFYAILDLRPLLPPGADDAMRELYASASPACHVAKGATDLPLYIARAGLDSPLINQGTDAFVAEALAANASVDVVNHRDGRHAFDILDNNDRSREIIRGAISFIKSSLLGNG